MKSYAIFASWFFSFEALTKFASCWYSHLFVWWITCLLNKQIHRSSGLEGDREKNKCAVYKNKNGFFHFINIWIGCCRSFIIFKVTLNIPFTIYCVMHEVVARIGIKYFTYCAFVSSQQNESTFEPDLYILNDPFGFN